MRVCEVCGKEIERRPGERTDKFKNVKTCRGARSGEKSECYYQLRRVRRERSGWVEPAPKPAPVPPPPLPVPAAQPYIPMTADNAPKSLRWLF